MMNMKAMKRSGAADCISNLKPSSNKESNQVQTTSTSKLTQTMKNASKRYTFKPA